MILSARGEFKKLLFVPPTHNRDFTLDRIGRIDEVDVVCDECGGEMKRTPEVLDGWFESGAMPLSSIIIRLKTKKKFEKRFPRRFCRRVYRPDQDLVYYTHAIAGVLWGCWI